MSFKHNILHLRIPFSFLLMPISLLALAQNTDNISSPFIVLFILLHLLIYPSSNGYNSYMDNDTGSIGGIENPPKVPKSMFHISIALDVISLLTLYLISGIIPFILLLSYIVASRLYSFRKIRLKQYPIIGFLTVTLFQGPVIYILCLSVLNPNFQFDFNVIISIVLSFLLIASGYPLSQIYQHEQDKNDKVKTLSLLLGIKGTFIFSSIMFFLIAISMVLLLYRFDSFTVHLIVFIVSFFPVFILFNNWMIKSFKNKEEANYKNTMEVNINGAISLNVFFIYLCLSEYLF